MKLLLKYLCLALIGGGTYGLIEILWRGYTFPSMILLGAISFLIIGLLNEIFPWEMPIEFQALIGGGTITFLELITGFIVNIKLNLNQWDYSHMPLNYKGQICLPFSLIWILLSFAIILVDDYIRFVTFKEEKPTYTSIWRWLKRKK